MIYIFIDTNIFLHFKMFIDIPWTKLFENSCELVIAPVVIDELDKHKRNSNPKISERAKKVLVRIETLLDNRDGNPKLHLANRPNPKTLIEYQLDRMEQDDRIIATIIEFNNAHVDDTIIFVTNDTGPRLRAKEFNIKCLSLPKEYENQNELSEEQKELKKLRRDYESIKNLQPKLTVAFRDETSILNYSKINYIVGQDDFVNEHYEKRSQDFPPLDFERQENLYDTLDQSTNNKYLDKSSKEIIKDYNSYFNRLSEAQVSGYNRDLTLYLHHYRRYLTDLWQYNSIKTRIHPIYLEIQNIGNTPAFDLDFKLSFPEGINVLMEDELPTKPVEPTPPYKPRGYYDNNIFSKDLADQLPSVYEARPSHSTNFILPDDLDSGTSIIFERHFEKIKHFQGERLDPYFFLINIDSAVNNFKIDYTITASNIPTQIKGSLSIIAANEDICSTSSASFD